MSINRINLILNGNQSLSKVLINLRNVICSNDISVIYTHEDKYGVSNALRDVYSMSEDEISSISYYEKFNQYKKHLFTGDNQKRLIFLRLPNLKFKTIPAAINSMLLFSDNVFDAHYCHYFSDDLVFKEAYNPEKYEEFIELYGDRIYLNAKTHPGNFIFNRLVPRFIFSTEKIPFKFYFYQYEGKDHFVIDRKTCKLLFDENLKKLYIQEFVIRCKENGLISHTTFYPDFEVRDIVVRDEEFPHTLEYQEYQEMLNHDEKYFKVTLKKYITYENDVSDIITRCSKIVENYRKD